MIVVALISKWKLDYLLWENQESFDIFIKKGFTEFYDFEIFLHFLHAFYPKIAVKVTVLFHGIV